MDEVVATRKYECWQKLYPKLYVLSKDKKSTKINIAGLYREFTRARIIFSSIHMPHPSIADS